MNCPECNKKVTINHVQVYPEALNECECGTIVDENGVDRTEEYYKEEI